MARKERPAGFAGFARLDTESKAAALTRAQEILTKAVLSAHDPTSGALILKRAEEIPQNQRIRYLRAMTGKRPRLAIGAFCRECVGWEDLPDSVIGCTARVCPLYPYRPMPRRKEPIGADAKAD